MGFNINWSVEKNTPHGTKFESRWKEAASSAEAMNYLQDILDDPELVDVRVSRRVAKPKLAAQTQDAQKTSAPESRHKSRLSNRDLGAPHRRP
jgi:hypothetical protein